jgi:hypothetical protein
MSFADNPTIGAMADGNSSLSGSIIVFALIFVLWLKLDARPKKGKSGALRRQLIFVAVLRI